jgi:hypothetical protein
MRPTLLLLLLLLPSHVSLLQAQTLYDPRAPMLCVIQVWAPWSVCRERERIGGGVRKPKNYSELLSNPATGTMYYAYKKIKSHYKRKAEREGSPGVTDPVRTAYDVHVATHPLTSRCLSFFRRTRTDPGRILTMKSSWRRTGTPCTRVNPVIRQMGGQRSVLGWRCSSQDLRWRSTLRWQ